MARDRDDGAAGKAKRGKLGGLFDDLSVPQVFAGALAAVTSMLLASQIGIYGSVIGVGVGSVVSAVASQLYKKFLTASAEKLRELKPGETGYIPPAAGKGASDESPAAGKTARLASAGTPNADDPALREDPAVQRSRERRDRRKKVQRGVIAVSVASAIVAVALSAFVIDTLTTGQGVGAKTPPLIPSVSQGQPASSGDGKVPDASSGDEVASSGKDAASDASKNATADDASKKDAASSGSSTGGEPSGGTQDPSGTSGTDGSSDSSGGSAGGSASGSGSDGGAADGSSGSQGAAPQPNADGSSGSDQGSGSGAGATGGK